MDLTFEMKIITLYRKGAKQWIMIFYVERLFRSNINDVRSMVTTMSDLQICGSEFESRKLLFFLVILWSFYFMIYLHAQFCNEK